MTSIERYGICHKSWKEKQIQVSMEAHGDYMKKKRNNSEDVLSDSDICILKENNAMKIPTYQSS